ncbi:MAG: DUF3866 family protein [Firmicutes bacterium]|nr:DUF3866 family protein [Bacillota bacterium]
MGGAHVREGRVVSVRRLRAGLWELDVELGRQIERALLYEALTPPAKPGDRVAVNTTAVDLGLGTGGTHFIVHVLGRERPAPAGPGHIMKLRYTPLQLRVLAAEEPASPHHATLVRADGVSGLPVVVAELHSQLAAAAAALRVALGDKARLVYIMTDGGALPLAVSRLVDALRRARFVDATVTVGHAFGGDVEAVTLFSGLLAARWVLGADAAVIAMGPGVVGTGTRYGTTAIETGQHVDAVGVMGGQAVAALRLSFADPRARHRGVSHHTLTALGRIAQRPCWVAIPALEPPARGQILRQLRQAGIAGRHRLVEVHRGREALVALERAGVPARSMGREAAEDPTPFLAAAAAGFLAADLVRRGDRR